MNTTSKFIILAFLLTSALDGFGLDIQITPSSFPCGTSTISATTGCSFMGAMEVTVEGNPNGVLVNSISNVVNGAFTFVLTTTAAAPASAQLNFRVLTSNDPTGCALINATDDVAVTLNCSCNLQVTPTIQHETCFGCNTGSIGIVITGSTAPTTYMWSNGATTASISGLLSGTYLLNVNDVNGCTFSGSYNIDAYACSPFTMNTTITNAICHDDCNGSIQLGSLSNGSTAFTVLWNEGQTTTLRSDLCAATYMVTVTDTDNCTSTASYMVTQPNEITITIDSVRNFTVADSGAVFFTTVGVDSPSSASCEVCVVVPGFGTICGACSDVSFAENLPAGVGRVTITLNTGCQIQSSPFTIGNVSSNKDYGKNQINIYPNPTSDVVNISTSDGRYPESVTAINAFGLIVARYYQTQRIDVSSLPSGIYYLVVHDEGHNHTRSFTIQR